MKDPVCNCSIPEKIEKTQGKRPYPGMQNTDNWVVSAAFPGISTCLCKYWPFSLTLASFYSFRKGLCSLKVSKQYLRTYVPKESSLSLIRVSLFLSLPGCKATEWAWHTELLLTSPGLWRWHQRRSQERNRAKGAIYSRRNGKTSKGWRGINTGKQESKKPSN